jgi:hypothetical protein
MNNSDSSIDIPMLVEESCIPLIASETISDHHQVKKTISKFQSFNVSLDS